MNNFYVFYSNKDSFLEKDRFLILVNFQRAVTKFYYAMAVEVSKKAGIYDEAVKILKEEDMEIFELSGIAPNPKIESVREGVKLCKENSIDMVLAIGGGSVIDCAKVVAAGACYDGDPWDLVITPRWIKKALPIYSVLTLSATGSEMDKFAVISDMSKK